MTDAMGHSASGGRDAVPKRLQRAVERRVRRTGQGRILPLPDEVAPRGWYRRFRQLLSRVPKR